MTSPVTPSSGQASEEAVPGEKTMRWGWWYFAESQIRLMRQYLVTIVVSAIGQPLLLLWVMGVGLGALIGANTGNVGGVPYLQFIAPALLASTALMSATSEFTYAIMGQFKWNKTYFGAASTSLSPTQIMVGQVLNGVVRFLAQAVLVLIVFSFFGVFTSGWAVLQVFTAVVGGLSMGTLIGGYVSGLEQDRGQIAAMDRFIIMPMFLFSGTFYPLAQLPGLLQWLGWLSPQWHAAQLGRVLSYGAAEPLWLTVTHVLYLLSLCAVGLAWMRKNYVRRLGEQ
ncbi:ABC transporter permease [Micrococcoides hystricis]|uniref:Transport permease protein n=1 Tax=Micrococcoides hystricis TaxID=1572761 RepID=A0ABV6PBD2_9MICC